MIRTPVPTLLLAAAILLALASAASVARAEDPPASAPTGTTTGAPPEHKGLREVDPAKPRSNPWAVLRDGEDSAGRAEPEPGDGRRKKDPWKDGDDDDGRAAGNASGSDGSFKPLAITLNPLSLSFLRFGANVEYLVARHHAIVVNPFVGAGSFTTLGAEAGYRFYLGTRGAHGLFAGPSLVFAHAMFPAGSLQTFGGAVDVGYQHVFDNGFTIGGGAGLMVLSESVWATVGESLVDLTGTFDQVVPRLLFTVGYSFQP